MTRAIGLTSLAAFVATVWFANWLVIHKGIVSVGFGLEAPAGVFAVGLALTLRDVVHRTLGRLWVVAAILVGCVLAYYLGASDTIPGGHVTLALASGTAFLLSELADLAVYEPVGKRSFVGAVALSNTVGAVVDSALFLWLAFGGLAFFWGQVVGKLEMTALAIPFLLLLRRAIPSKTSTEPAL